jgi:hypothetical protein
MPSAERVCFPVARHIKVQTQALARRAGHLWPENLANAGVWQIARRVIARNTVEEMG